MPGKKQCANTRMSNYTHLKNKKVRQIRKDKGKLSDNTIDNKKFR